MSAETGVPNTDPNTMLRLETAALTPITFDESRDTNG